MLARINLIASKGIFSDNLESRHWAIHIKNKVEEHLGKLGWFSYRVEIRFYIYQNSLKVLTPYTEQECEKDKSDVITRAEDPRKIHMDLASLIRKGYVDVVQALLEARALVDTYVIMKAVQLGYFTIVNLLINAKAILESSSHGDMLLSVLRECNELLLSFIDKEDTILLAYITKELLEFVYVKLAG